MYSADNNTNISLNADDLTKVYGEDTAFNVSLYDNDVPVKGENINITLSNAYGASKSYSFVTDDDGYVFLPINLGVGDYSVKSSYQNLVLYNSINVLERDSPYIVSEDFTEVYGEGKYFIGALYDSYGKPIPGMHLSLNLTRLSNGAYKVYDTVSDYAGLYRLQINLAPGFYSVLSRFDGLNVSSLFYKPAVPVLNSITVTRESPSPVINDTITLNDVIKSSSFLVDYVRSNGTLPNSLELNSGTVSISSFIYLLSQCVSNIESGVNDLVVTNVSLPPSTPINNVKGVLSKSGVISLGSRLSNFVKSNSRLPSYDSSNGLGSLSFENYAYILAEFLDYYGDYGVLPNSLSVDTSIFYKGGVTEDLGNYTLTVLYWGSGGDLSKNNVVMNNIPHTSLTSKVLEECNKGTVMLSFGNGNGPSVMINAGTHGNELSSIAATFHLINTLANAEINGTVNVICDLCPYSGSTSTRFFKNVNLNSVANVDGTLSNNLIKLIKSLGCNVFGDFHCTQPGGDPGKDVAMGTYSPVSESSVIAKYISNVAGVSSLIYSRAGAVYAGAIEDVCNLNGIPAVTCEVLTPHGTIRSGSVNTSYNMMLTLLKYKGINI